MPTKDEAARRKRLPPGAFICAGEKVVRNSERCEHCGATEKEICRFYPGVAEKKIEAASAMLAALKAAQDGMSRVKSVHDPFGPLNYAIGQVDAAIAAAEAAGIKEKEQ